MNEEQEPQKKDGKCPTPNERGECSNMRFTQLYDSETYHCDVCGQHYKLYYEDMA